MGESYATVGVCRLQGLIHLVKKGRGGRQGCWSHSQEASGKFYKISNKNEIKSKN